MLLFWLQGGKLASQYVAHLSSNASFQKKCFRCLRRFCHSKSGNDTRRLAIKSIPCCISCPSGRRQASTAFIQTQRSTYCSSSLQGSRLPMSALSLAREARYMVVAMRSGLRAWKQYSIRLSTMSFSRSGRPSDSSGLCKHGHASQKPEYRRAVNEDASCCLLLLREVLRCSVSTALTKTSTTSEASFRC